MRERKGGLIRRLIVKVEIGNGMVENEKKVGIVEKVEGGDEGCFLWVVGVGVGV